MFWFVDGQQSEVDEMARTNTKPRETTAHVISHDDLLPSPVNDKKVAETCRIQVKITGMTCSSCVNKIETSLGSMKGKTVCLCIYIHTQWWGKHW